MMYIILLFAQMAFANTYADQKALVEKVDVTEHMGENISTYLEFVHHSGKPMPLTSLMNREKPLLVTLNYFSRSHTAVWTR